MTRTPIAIIGRSCRLPSAYDVDAFWRLLVERRCTVSTIDDTRWSTHRFLHARKGEQGKTYTFAAGVLDNVWGFDPTVFSISPREAEQMDPQQRLALQLVWEALEDAGVPPSKIANTETGVFVGASALDYASRGIFDGASIGPYFATGNTLSIISNRISYAFDLRGPSFTIDTACSSSLVALHEAALAIETGRIDTAVVVGVNILVSPMGFVSFAQASMLSPRGLCRAFDAGADGYVRSEGGVALVLRAESAARAAGNFIQTRILGSGVNSDGRTVGMSFPSVEAQVALLARVYHEAGVAPEALAFVEAHGTGTRVGDPAEAQAVGRALATRRAKPLLLGSVKTNVGHLEPASGLVGLLKATLALEHNLLPASLHVENLNPDIPFDDLNLRVATEPVQLANGKAVRAAGVNSFGFGGTNAHVIVADPEFEVPAATEITGLASDNTPVLALSARSPEALHALTRAYAGMLTGRDAASSARVAASVAASRDLLSHRLVVNARNPESWASHLADASNGETDHVIIDTAVGRDVPLAFVYSGNGSQWAGMGRAFHEVDADFREQFAEVDVRFFRLSGWSLREALFADDLGARLRRAEVSQPLLFVTQVATTTALRARGVEPSVVFGHSVGEIAAAHAAGALTLEQCVEVIYSRSHHQEQAWNTGTMAAVLLTPDETDRLISEGGFSEIEIAAVNSERSLTVSGPQHQIREMAKLARSRRVAFRILELDYPFHTALIDGVRAPLLTDLVSLTPCDGYIPFISPVTGDVLPGSKLDAQYWWRNVRHRVRFADAVARAIRHGARLFVEIGPRPVLQNYIIDGLKAVDVEGAVVGCNDHAPHCDPIGRTLARVIAKGGAVNRSRVFGELRGRPDRLPTYPWQNHTFVVTPTVEMQDVFGLDRANVHPLIGSRSRSDSTEWTVHLDPNAISYLADHKVGGRVVVPAAALAEMALAAGRAWLESPTVELLDFDIQRGVVLDTDGSLEITTRISPESRTVEILSRPRLRDEPRTLHAFGRVSVNPSRRAPVLPEPTNLLSTIDGPALYEHARAHGLDYGPAFQGAERVEAFADGVIRITLAPQNAAQLAADGYNLYPPALDSCFHGLIHLYAERNLSLGAGVAYLPVRFGEMRVYKPGTPVRVAWLTVRRVSERSLQSDFAVLDERGEIVATLFDCRFRTTVLDRRTTFDRLTYHYGYEQLAPPLGASESEALAAGALRRMADGAGITVSEAPTRSNDDLLLEAFAVSLAHESIIGVLSRRRQFTIDELVAAGTLAGQSVTLFRRLLEIMRERGYAQAEGERWRVVSKTKLPRAGDILRTVIAEYPARVAESVLGARAAALLARVLHDGPGAESPYADTTVLQLAGASPSALGRIDAITALVKGTIAQWPPDRPLRILEISAGGGALTRQLAPLAADARVTVMATDPDPIEAERLRIAFAGRPGIRTEQLDFTVGDTGDLGRFDLAVCAVGLGRALANPTALQRLFRLLTDGGAVALAVFAPSTFADVVFGITPGWFSRSVADDFPIGLMRDATEWIADLDRARFSGIDVANLADSASPAWLVLASRRKRSVASESPQKERGHVVVVGEATRPRLIDALTLGFETAGLIVHMVDGNDHDKRHGGSAGGPWGSVSPLVGELTRNLGESHNPVDIIALGGCELDGRGVSSRVAMDIGRILGLARSVHRSAVRLWVVLPGAFQGIVEGGRDCPSQAAHAGFLRVLANETKDLDLRVVDVDANLDDERGAAEIVRTVMNPRTDREIVITEQGVRAARLRHGVPCKGLAAASAGHRVVSQLSTGRTGIDSVNWIEKPLVEPGAGEVAIDIVAAGLNFRDVMWSLGLLPEEALEDGFAGPTLGIEGAGTVVAVGPGVRRVRCGDRVVAFASGAFASRVVAPEAAVAPLPARLSFEAGATIPVAFLTSYYALHHLARLTRGEWLLVHGGAGGVGLAALQIARWRGARTIATAGSEEKRDFLRMLGADHVLSSRNLDFVDDVRTITDGEGVDVVLNSLAGEAMERSVQIVRPFGRFLELGKRDYYANARIGLRPFRRNVSYFGIDVDQLLAHHRPLTERLFREIVRQFERGVFAPLPYRTVGPDGVREAFRLMQQSLHVGKIVIAPPPVVAVADAPAPFAAASDGTHLVVGGLGGFGLKTAEWLVERGARYLVLVGRSGAASDEAKESVRRLEQMGATVRVAACDVAETADVANLISDVARTMPPLKGVIHAAMVLDDGLIENLTSDRTEAVLRPKIDGAANLDRLTRETALDYFVLFSSATTVIGNPGQANYVAANAYLESLARMRRADGLPALAVAWGAIEDAGYLARKSDVRDKLARRLGQAGLSAQEALEALGRLLVETDGGKREAGTLVVAPIDWPLASRELKVVGSPVYAQVVAEAGVPTSVDGVDRVDLVALVRGRDREAAREAVAEILATEISRILKLPAKELGPQRSLAELGMDSLMGLELRLGIERRFGIDVPLPSISQATTLASLAAAIVGRVQDIEPMDAIGADETHIDLARRHVADGVTMDELAEIGEAVRSRQSEGERIL
jgi:acyl transferase domain-containing protein/NADPH:quinone reductase-like Zn-dependent oxidoreductase/short-subunit dehydrogenase/acyl carrier protein